MIRDRKRGKHHKRYENQAKEWKRGYWRRLMVYGLSGLLPFGALVILALQIAFPTPVPEWLSNLVDQDAMGKVIGAIGTTAVVIAWLINVTGQTACGKRIGELAQWAYPHFYHYYFFCFLANFFLGDYIANGSHPHRFATALITLSLSVGVIFIGRVCFVFVISQKARERVAYAYYKETLQYRADDNVDAEQVKADFRSASEQALLCLTEYVAKTEAAGGELPFATIFDLWQTFIESYREAFPEKNGDLSFGCCSLAERFWDALIKAQPYEPVRSGFLLYVVAEAEDGPCRDHLLVGLLLRMKRAHCREDHGWDKECELLFQLIVRSREREEQTPETGRHALQKLVLGLSSIMGVETLLECWLPDFDRLQELSRRVKLTAEAFDNETEGQFLRALWRVYNRENGYEDGIYSKVQGWIDFPIMLSQLLEDQYKVAAAGKDAAQVRRAVVCWTLNWMDAGKGDVGNG